MVLAASTGLALFGGSVYAQDRDESPPPPGVQPQVGGGHENPWADIQQLAQEGNECVVKQSYQQAAEKLIKAMEKAQALPKPKNKYAKQMEQMSVQPIEAGTGMLINRFWQSMSYWPELEKLCKARVDFLERFYGAESAEYKTNLERLSAVLRKLNKGQEASKYEQMLSAIR